MKKAVLTVLALACTSLGAHVVESTDVVTQSASDPNGEYHKHEILGWTVHILEDDVSDRPETAEAMLWFIRGQLADVTQRMPQDKVKLLRTVEIWINDDGDEDDTVCPFACYIPNRFVGSRFFRDRRESVILRDFDGILESAWCCTDTLLIHELAHAYHDLFIEDGFNNDEIEDAYDDAVDSELYDDNPVMYPWWEDLFVEHYGMTDDEEFFATMTETWFNDYYTFPFNIGDLYIYDYDTYDLIYRAWYTPVNGSTVVLSQPNSLEVPQSLMTPPMNQ